MTDRAAPKCPQEPADVLEVTVSTGAESRSTPVIAAPMLDVYAPHEAIHTWKSFFIHIATISIGLLIAIGLEQTVETLHHRHQLNELHDSLRQDAQKAIEDSGKIVTVTSRRLDWLSARAQQLRAAPCCLRMTISLLGGAVYPGSAGARLFAVNNDQGW